MPCRVCVPSLCDDNVVEGSVATPEACESDLDRHDAAVWSWGKQGLRRFELKLSPLAGSVYTRSTGWMGASRKFVGAWGYVVPGLRLQPCGAA